jgi:hypothetical protein
VTPDLRVSVHALIRFRNRYMMPSEQDIGDEVAQHWLNAEVRRAQVRGTYEDVLDEDKVLRVVELPARVAGEAPVPPCYVLLRDVGTRHATIVTILNAWMRDQNRRNRWSQLDGSPFHETTTGRVPKLRATVSSVARVR